MLRCTPRYNATGSLSGDWPSWFSALLLGRGVDTAEKAERFLHPSLAHLHDPFRMHDMDRAVSIIRRAREEKKRVLVYGDYDVDGICASTIMTEALREMGMDVRYRLPDRNRDGYGLHTDIVREIATEVDLLITVDCGITNHEEVALARSLGLTVIVTDHHEPAETLPEADAVLNPLLGNYPFPRLCGAGVALKVVQALLGTEGILTRLDLAALATVADVVPLTDENRVLVTEGLKHIQTPSRPGIRELLRVSDLSGNITATDIAFRIAPRLNAGGRLEDASQCVELLLTRDPAIATGIASHLQSLNQQRQETERAIQAEAAAMLPSVTDFRRDRILILCGKEWNKGIIGLVAGKLCERYHFPVIVLTDHDGESTGSCRSIPGVNIHAMLSLCGDLFIRFGGHEQAAGLTIATDRIPELRQRLNEAIRTHCSDECYIPEQEYDLALRLDEITPDMVDRLRLLEPCGCGNPSPLFLIRDCHVQESRPVGKDRNHLRLRVLQSEKTLDCIGFSMVSRVDSGWTRVDLVGSPEMNEFMGRSSLQMRLEAVRPTGGACELPAPETLFPAFLQDLVLPATNQKETPLPECLSRARAIQLLKKPMGTLLLTTDRDLAVSLSQESGCEILGGKVRDPRGFSSVLWFPAFSALTDLWQDILIPEADCTPGLPAFLAEKCPNASLHLLPSADPEPAFFRGLSTDTDLLRRIYLEVRKGPRPLSVLASVLSLPEAQILIALFAFRDTGLITSDRNITDFHPVPAPPKCSMEDSPLIRLLRQLRPLRTES